MYTLQLADNEGATTSVDVYDPADVAIPQVGDPLPPFDTPTVDDGRGVNPICTREPACPLHDRTQSSALEAGQPLAYLIGTPAYCKTAVCGPVLDLLLDEQDSRPDLAMVHAEVYTDDTIEVVAPGRHRLLAQLRARALRGRRQRHAGGEAGLDLGRLGAHRRPGPGRGRLSPVS